MTWLQFLASRDFPRSGSEARADRRRTRRGVPPSMLGCLISTPLSFDQGELTGGRVRFGRWVPQEKKCGRAGEGTRLKAAKADLPWDAARMLRAYNATLDDAVELAVREKYDDFTYKKAVHQCDHLDGAAAAIRVAEAAENRVA